jgi:predicted nuclease with TOPRIM domain
MSEIMHENYVDRLYAGTLNEDDAKRADELVAENARLTENLRVLRGKVASLMDENAIIANERNAARDENARLTEKFAVKTARLSTELRIGMEQRDAALAENARLNPGDVYQIDSSDPNSLAKVVEHASPGTVWMEFTKDNSWGKCGKRFAVHPAFVGTKVPVR